MTIEQLKAQLLWLLDQLAAVHESYAASGREGKTYKDPDDGVISHGDYLWRLEQRIDSTRKALKLREEIKALTAPTLDAEVRV